MKAVAYQIPGSLDRDQPLSDVNLDDPVARGRDLLVEVKAVSVNPVVCKVRAAVAPEPGQWKVLGWDVAGVVVSTGDAVQNFSPGDSVWYAGSIARDGANSELHLVDERIVGPKPERLSFPESAALPLTGITAWEMLFDRLQVGRPVAGAPNAIVIIGGAGGVGSAAIQLLRALTDLTVIASASRPATRAWVERLGAHHVIDHSEPLAPQIQSLGIAPPPFVFSTNSTAQYVTQIAELISPQGRFGLIDDPPEFDIRAFKRKSVSVHWEFMFTRAVFETDDIEEQGRLLRRLSELVDSRRIESTATEIMRPINAANLIAAQRVLESGTARGKIVLEGF
ncbi:MAG TPA: zinc-binding alcohol dehydrogenase family protein [Gammaproteobacteria bacterium]|nr:zinc-binding alcohol dehydrogenase family protein [Gammaproteobacteria bacterium]